MITQDDKTLERQRLKEVYPALCADIAAVLLHHDPVGLNFGLNTDEYMPEARRIIPQLRKAHSPEELCRAIHAMFTSVFGADLAGPEDAYEALAREVWAVWKRYISSP
ncbi:MAG: hypothetical protein NZT92_16460 [Abditibacteriales bacterium]|nr:hypothetical protein [Abditibacteriales bacterium]MDW8365149.1 hypothetical protein [Abditibacteriales bacterium]